MKVSILLLPLAFYLGFLTRILISMSCKRFCRLLLRKVGHF